MTNFVLADSPIKTIPDKQNARGVSVFTLSELRGITARDKKGALVNTSVQSPIFGLMPEERIGIMQSSAYVHSVISNRMNRISSFEWDVIHKKELEDNIYYSLSDLKNIYLELDDPGDMRHLIYRSVIFKHLSQQLYFLKPDLSNFDACMVRYRRHLKNGYNNQSERIKDWLYKPNNEDDFSDFAKKWVEALLLHGGSSLFKQYDQSGRLSKFYVLPGGTVYPVRSIEVGGYVAYVQMAQGHFPKLYFEDEAHFTNYLPSAARSHGYVPLDALVNKVAEQLMFDAYAAERADGTKEPEKLIIFGDTKSPFSDFTGDEYTLPMNADKQRRIEDKLNVLRRGAISTLSGVGTPIALDISKADTFAAQDNRQDKLLRDIGLVFNMTNMEMNLAGGQFTSGKETSESQQEIEEGKGSRPIARKLQSIINKVILPSAWGMDYVFQYKKGLSDFDQVNLDALKWASGTYTKNEIRDARGDHPVLAPGNDTLGEPQTGGAPDGGPFSPINVRAL